MSVVKAVLNASDKGAMKNRLKSSPFGIPTRRESPHSKTSRRRNNKKHRSRQIIKVHHGDLKANIRKKRSQKQPSIESSLEVKSSNMPQNSKEEQNPSEEQMKLVTKLLDNANFLRSTLRKPLFREACFRKGIDPQQLIAKSLSEFRIHPTTTTEMARRSQNLFEEHRKECLFLAVMEEDVLREEESNKQRKIKEREEYLLQLLEERLNREKRHLERISRKRQKYENVINNENSQILAQRNIALSRFGNFDQRAVQIHLMRAKSKQEFIAKAKERRKKQLDLLKLRKSEDNKLRNELLHRMKVRDQRIEKFQNKRQKQMMYARTDDTESSLRRIRRTQQAADQEKKKRESMQIRMAQKEVYMNKQLKERRDRLEEKRMARQILTQKKSLLLARVQASKAYEKKLKAVAMKEESSRRERMQEINRVIEEQRKEMMREEKIRRDNWKISTPLQRAITPGPGHYELPDTLNRSGGTWGTTSVKSFLDEIALTGSRTPGPGSYSNNWSSLDSRGGCMAQKVPSELDHAIRRASKLPGPGQYTVQLSSSGGSQVFSKTSAPGMLDTVVRQHRDVPGPGTYTTAYMPKRREELKLQKDTKNIVTAALMLKKLGITNNGNLTGVKVVPDTKLSI